jgi:hypothetical protein
MHNIVPERPGRPANRRARSCGGRGTAPQMGNGSMLQTVSVNDDRRELMMEPPLRLRRSLVPALKLTRNTPRPQLVDWNSLACLLGG